MANTGNEVFLPQDIITNILKRLPIKSIIRFRCVCKNWKNLFKTPQFIAEHARHTDHENPLLLLIEYDSSDKEKPLFLRLVNHNMESIEVMSIPSFNPLDICWKIVASCNGLLLVKNGYYVDEDGLYSPSLFLMNPMIREVRKIPHPTDKVSSFWYIYGLGFTSVSDDYKIVRFYKRLSSKKKENMERPDGVEVYSLSTSSWTEVELGGIWNTTITSTAVSCDGTILWLGSRDSSHVVVSFDIATEVFTFTPLQLPNREVHRQCTTTTLGLHQNKLSVFERYKNDSFNSINSWVMEEVASESGKRFCCSTAYNFDYIAYFFKPLCIWRNEIVCLDEDECYDEDEDYSARKSKFFMRLFNITTKEWKEFRNFPCDTYECEGCSYERSLVSVWKTKVE